MRRAPHLVFLDPEGAGQGPQADAEATRGLRVHDQGMESLYERGAVRFAPGDETTRQVPHPS